MTMIFLAACQTAPVATPTATPAAVEPIVSSDVVTTVPDPIATPDPTVTMAPTRTATSVGPTSPATGQPPTLPTRPIAPTPAVMTASEAMIYTSEAGGFSIELPPQTAVYPNAFPSADGLFAELPDSVTFIRESPNYAVTVAWTAVDETLSLPEFVDQQSFCFDVQGEGGQPMTIGGVAALLYDESNCGVFITTYLYFISDGRGYTVTIRSLTPYRDIEPFVQEQLDSFTFN